jgi:hypothetical protein
MSINVSIVTEALKFIYNAVKDIDFSKFAIPSIKKDECVRRLISAYRNEDLVLVLGAGVSVPYNLPDWNTSLKNLLLQSIQKGKKQELLRLK